MSEASDPAIKLFGKTIPLPEIAPRSAGAPAEDDVVLAVVNDESIDRNRAASPADSSCESDSNRDGDGGGGEQETAKDSLGKKPVDNKKEEGAPTQAAEEFTNPDADSMTGEESITPSIEKEATTLKASKSEEDQSETSNSQEKTLKKPDKILPCPRCSSMDTKFCYYNNYNVNQPRHFCKNCQRYWTSGGTMRNVPVGAGRRKNKNSASHYRQIAVSEALHNARTELPNGVHHPALKSNGKVLTFGSDTPLCESMASVLNLADKTMHNQTRNGFQRPEELRIPVTYASGEKGDDHSNKSSVMSTKPMEDTSINRPQEQVMQNCQSFPPQVPYFPGAPWPFPWNPAQWRSPVPPPHAFCTPGFTMPFYPAAAYWGCALSGAWNVPWLAQPSSPSSGGPNSGPNSPTLGKHSREENMLKINDPGGEDEHRKENNKEKCLWVPKTLRIDDPGEAAKSSIWTTLGIKNNKADSIQGGGLFKAFPPKGDGKDHSVQSSTVLQANPAALSRSLNFHETS